AEGKKLIGVFDVEVVFDTSQLQTEMRRRFPHAGLKVSAVNGRIMLSGTAPDGPTVDKAVLIAKQFGPDVINSISVLQPQTVVVAGVLSGTAPFGVIVSKMLAAGMETDVIINALEQKGVARSLAEPNLVALSGDTASFLAGGEYPIPVPGSLGTVTIDYKRYGVSLAFTPTVLSDGLINLKIEPEVSQLDTSHPVQVAGISVPPLIVRRASTTVELRDGQSFVIGGLLQSNGRNAISQLPWLGDVPVIGALFRSAQYQKDETDLAIIVTPRLVRPARPGDTIKTPLDSSLPV